MFTNQGTIRKASGAATSVIDANFANQGGTIDVQTGTIQIFARTGSASTGGTFTVSGGAVLDLTGAVSQTHAMTGTYTGSGRGK